jgi:hypothetical protein
MSFQEFELLPWEPGWKYEYWEGVAHITPRHRVVSVRSKVRPRDVDARGRLRQVRPEDGTQLVSTYAAAFEDTMDYCDYDSSQIPDSARSNVRDFFNGTRGMPLPASRVTLDERGDVIGAAFLIREEGQPPLLDMLFVAPVRRRSGLATSMVSAASIALHDAGERFLDSRFMQGNEASEAWHLRFGFVELPDLTLAQSRYRAAQHELWRRERTERIADAERGVLNGEVERLRQRVTELEIRAEAEGWEAVHPNLRRR